MKKWIITCLLASGSPTGNVIIIEERLFVVCFVHLEGYFGHHKMFKSLKLWKYVGEITDLLGFNRSGKSSGTFVRTQNVLLPFNSLGWRHRSPGPDTVGRRPGEACQPHCLSFPISARQPCWGYISSSNIACTSNICSSSSVCITSAHL